MTKLVARKSSKIPHPQDGLKDTKAAPNLNTSGGTPLEGCSLKASEPKRGKYERLQASLRHRVLKVKRYLNSAQPEAAPSSTMHISGSISAGSSRFWRKFTEEKTNYPFKLTKTWLKLMLSRKKLFGRGWKVNKVHAIHKKKTNVNAKESRVRKVSSERPLVEKYKVFNITDDSLLSHWWNGLTWN